jgi:hypothetical protein
MMNESLTLSGVRRAFALGLEREVLYMLAELVLEVLKRSQKREEKERERTGMLTRP